MSGPHETLEALRADLAHLERLAAIDVADYASIDRQVYWRSMVARCMQRLENSPRLADATLDDVQRHVAAVRRIREIDRLLSGRFEDM